MAKTQRIVSALGCGLMFVLGLWACAGNHDANSGATAPTGPAHAAAGVASVLPATAAFSMYAARFSPLEPVADAAFGRDSEGAHGFASGIRYSLRALDGAVISAEDRMVPAPTSIVALPGHLGGGYLFVVGKSVYFARTWTAKTRVIYVTQGEPQTLSVGLDRVYLTHRNGIVAAFDAQSGSELDRGPYPAIPKVSAFAAIDAFHAAALGDYVGLTLTRNAGRDWATVPLPFAASKLSPAPNGYIVSGFEKMGGEEHRYTVTADGVLMPGFAARASTPESVYGAFNPEKVAATGVQSAVPTEALRMRQELGDLPLGLAVKRGAAHGNDQAYVLHRGSLYTVELSTGVVRAKVPNVYPLQDALCTALAGDRTVFLCGVALGATEIVGVDGKTATVLAHFDQPRRVQSARNGRYVVTGGCGALSVPPDLARAATGAAGERGGWVAELSSIDPLKLENGVKDAGTDGLWQHARDGGSADGGSADGGAPTGPLVELESSRSCLVESDGKTRELVLRGDTENAELVPLADGSIAVVSPPRGDFARARVAIVRGESASAVLIAEPRAAGDARRILKNGVWLSGFYEKSPGVIGGWAELSGSYVGFEIRPTGELLAGPAKADDSLAIAGPKALHWSVSRFGEQSNDGGLTWETVDVPEPLAPLAPLAARPLAPSAPMLPGAVRPAARTLRTEGSFCSDQGCIMHGWVRTAWGKPKDPLVLPQGKPLPSYVAPLPLELACTPTQLLRASPTASPPVAAVSPTRWPRPGPGPAMGGLFGAPPLTAPAVTHPVFMPFLGIAPPIAPEMRTSIDINDQQGRYPRRGRIAKLYAWAQSEDTWETQARVLLRFTAPYASKVYSTHMSQPTPSFASWLRLGILGHFVSMQWSALASVEGEGTLFSGRSWSSGKADLTVLLAEPDRPLVQVTREDGEPFGEILGASRVGGQWVIAASALPSELPSIHFFTVDGALAKPLAKLPPLWGASRVTVGLAVDSATARVGLVVDGDAAQGRTAAERWVIPIDLHSGAQGAPEALGAADFSDAPNLGACTAVQGPGFVYDAPLVNRVKIMNALPEALDVRAPLKARVRSEGRSSCLLGIAGSIDSPLIAGPVNSGVSALKTAPATASKPMFSGAMAVDEGVQGVRCLVR